MKASKLIIAAMTVALSPITFAQRPDYGMPITAAQAKAAAAAAVEVMNENNWAMAVAVVDPSGNLVYFEKVDATQHASVTIAIEKARSAAAFKRPTKIFADALANNAGLATLPGVIGSEGGVPIVVNGRIIGALGCSGGTGQQDGVACNAGAAALD
jgi:uncharacterized protein GlcG (DUF336 family)